MRARGILGVMLVFGFGVIVAFVLELNLIDQIFKDIPVSDAGGK